MLQIIETADGSLSLFNHHLKETYHSKHGAIQESSHVFIENGFAKYASGSSRINILEVGFGTGLNSFLTCLFNAKKSLFKEVYYVALEPFPVDSEIIDKFASQFSDEDASLFLKFHTADWNANVSISENFVLRKEHVTLQNYQSKNNFDLVYYDAFGPSVESNLWEREALKKTVDVLTPNGIWVSYCAKGSVRRLLQSFNMQMFRLEGPPGKREMLMGKKIQL